MLAGVVGVHGDEDGMSDVSGRPDPSDASEREDLYLHLYRCCHWNARAGGAVVEGIFKVWPKDV